MRKIITLFLFLLLLPCAAFGHSAEEAHSSGTNRAAPQDGGKVGLDERLGGRLPLKITVKDETGHLVRLGDLVTGPTLILPVYYGCTNVCNFLQWGVAGVIPMLPGVAGKDYRVLSISIDDTDTSEHAAHARRMYLDSFKTPLPPTGWRFLTADREAIRQLTDAAGYHFKRQGHEIMHPVASFVSTGDGVIVRYLYGTTFLPKDLALAFVEARQGKGGATIRKVVDFCFSFDPKSKSYEFNLLRVSATVVILCTGSFLAYLIFGGRKGKGRVRGSDETPPSPPCPSP